MQMNMLSNLRSVLANILFVTLAFASLATLSACDEPTPSEKVQNASEELSEGVEDASEELQDRSATEKMGDAVEDAGEKMQDSAH